MNPADAVRNSRKKKMPFDGSVPKINAKRRREAREAAELLGSVYHRFATGEWHWIQWTLLDWKGGRCAIGGIKSEAYFRAENPILAMSYLVRSIEAATGCTRKKLPEVIISSYNDNEKFWNVMKVIDDARLLAEKDARCVWR